MMTTKRTRKKLKLAPKAIGGANGQIELAPVEVADPYDPNRLARITVMRNVAAKPIDQLHARKHLDDAHKIAADTLAGLLQAAEIGGAQAIDYSALRVDTSRVERTISERGQKAAQALAEVRHDLGRRQYDFICRVVQGGFTIHDLAREIDGGYTPSHRTRLWVTDTIRRVLDDLVHHFGVGKGREQATIRVQRAAESLSF